MWTKICSKTYRDVEKKEIWALWKDVNNWASWHNDLDYVKMEGAFEVGNHFLLKPKGGPEVKIRLTEVHDEKKFVDCTYFPGAKMYDTHELEETPEGLKITNTVTVTGFLGLLWIKLVANDVATSAPHEMEAIVDLARSKR